LVIFLDLQTFAWQDFLEAKVTNLKIILAQLKINSNLNFNLKASMIEMDRGKIWLGFFAKRVWKSQQLNLNKRIIEIRRFGLVF